MSPRRSSRARSSQLPPAALNHTNSTMSSASKTDRDPPASHRPASQRRPSTQRSESIDGADSASRSELLAPRRSRRNGAEKEPTVKQQRDDHEEGGVEADTNEEEVTRCICGQAEYPGPSASIRQQQPNAAALTDETGNFFVQCDKCGVWQHGGCMGLLDESMLPDEYYCELCKPEYHKVTKSANGPKSSRYLPVLGNPSGRSSPLSSTAEAPRKKDAKNKLSEATKRRATMNSRGAYDEDEMLRRAIEESSKEIGSLGKRTRDESEDHKANNKRQRTGSNSSSTVSKHSESPDPPGQDASNKTNGTGRIASQKLRGAAARNNREKEMQDKQKEQQALRRAEAANKRNARSERRRGEDSPPPTPSLSPSKMAQVNGKLKADTPPSGRSNNNRRTGRPAARRGRLGRNQYTRDHGDEGTPARDGSHDINGGSPSGANGIHGESGRSSKAKTHPARTSLNEMKRRVAAILEFVGHMQTETASHPHSHHSNGNGSASSSKSTGTPIGVKTSTHLPTSSLVRAVEAGLHEAQGDGAIGVIDDKDFGTMDSGEMMETLTKELVHWQTVYGVYSR
ncbi:Histone deacetylase complex subunit [Exophiala dermatitidis]|uniref:Zinc finger PHD-type domain-containing protein n=2 Tax=Exophiala dermatitidis TaxID=5970 RepID=H6C605_EXODN|nr:uncharacterized protein HMPREF1120_07149 [Exophiala dermatitidis NIH/UT8656]KAJ4516249.1 Histone deacetylase complex subunit [Exophiala dermatitidis]EHY59151.1 hypothetical protein HMPREF1120_07149 [Exophiala dermatitidis NIH/UT8656]KAJ4526384.1 Histone deacetylase complex subunit [Exophiala dermatitidis]KAJ4532374.1 Histone deacetylase complex subunit [Exophiala dermatitidis]KAJ4546413.1 Histone deacetylase complex subunit [Exophiala dermatitidis]